MSNVVVNLNGRNIEVISVEDLGDKKRIFIGDVDSDVILRSTSGVKVQVGTKIVDLNLTYDGNNNSLTSSSLKQYQNIEDNFSSIEGSLEDGDLLYDTEKGRLYVYSGGALVRLTNTSDEKQYLSFLDHQSLTGDQKILMLKNAGLSVSTLKSLTTFLPDEVFANMFVYVAEEKQHYCLVGDNPRSQASWSPVYLSTEKGGIIKSGVIITPDNKTTLKQAFHINGYYDSDTINDISETQSIFTIGDANLNKGLAAWANTDGNIYIESLDSEINTGFVFNTKTGNLKHSLLYLQGERVGINTTPKQNYSNAIGGRTLFEDKIYIKDNISTELFAGGFAGYGMRLGKDPYGYWTLDIDNLSVRQRMSVYELVVNQIKATNGSLWVSDGAKIKSCIKYAEMPVYVKARYAGNYRSIGANQYEEIPIEERPPYAKVFDPIENSGNLIPFKMGLGYGDYYLDIPGDEAIYTHPGYDTYIENNGVYSMVSPTHRLDPVLGFVEDTGGEYVLVDTVNIYGTTYEDMPPFFEGDLIRMQSWDPTLNAIRFARCQVGIQRKSSDAVDSKPEVLMYVFQKDDLVQGLSLVRVGNNKDAIMSEFAVSGGTIIREKTRGLQIVGATWIRDIEITQAEPNRLGAIYLTAADSGAPYIDIIDKVASHNAFNPASSEPNKNSPYTEVMQTRLKVRLGKLATLVDLDMGLDGGLWQNNLYGLYTDSGFFKGNLVAQAGKIGDFFLKEGVMFTYNDGNVHTPMDFAYENNNNPTTSTGKINTNYLFGKSVAGVLLDGKKSRFSLGNRLTFENGVLTIGEVEGIGDLVTIINNLEDSVDADFINALKGNFTSISGGLISTSVVRLGSVTRDINGSITGWVDRAGMSGLDDSGETSVRLWAGETLANRNIAPFRILQNGSFYSTKGEIAGWTIAEDALYKDKNTVGTGMFSSAVNNVAFYAGTTYANLKLDKENAAFYVLDDGSFKSTKGTIGSINIANNKLYTTYMNGNDKMRLDNDGLTFLEDSGLEKAGIKNTSYSLASFISGSTLKFRFPATFLETDELNSNSATVVNSSELGTYDATTELSSLRVTHHVVMPSAYLDPATYNMNVSISTDFVLVLQKDISGTWTYVSEIGRTHNVLTYTTDTSDITIPAGTNLPHIKNTVSIMSTGSYRVQLIKQQEINVTATDSTTGDPITPLSITSTGRLNLAIQLPENVSRTDMTLKRVGTFMHLNGITAYSSANNKEQYFSVELNTTGFFLNSKGSFQIVAPAGGYSNIPGVLIAGEVNRDGSSASYWTGGTSTAITRRTAQGRYEVDVSTCLTHTNWYPAVICKYNSSSFIKASAQVSKENVNVGGFTYNRLTVNVFDTDNGISIDCPFYFYVFGRNEEFSFV